MRSTDGWLWGLIFAAGLVSLLLALRSISRQWASRWLALRGLPRWLQAGGALALAWLALRLARGGWRPLLAFVVLLAILALWGELAVRRSR